MNEAILMSRSELNAWDCLGKIMLAIVIAVSWTTVFVQLFPLPRLSPFQAGAIQTILLGVVVAPAIYHFLLIPLRQKTIREEKIFLSLHDPLTELPKRNLFIEILDHEIKAAERNAYQLAVAIIDPSSMSEINQALGFDYGDDIFKQCASRLIAAVRESDVVARIDADAFALIFPRIDSHGLSKIEKKLKYVFDRPFISHDLPISIGSSIGISIYPDHADSVELLLQRADIALHRCKQEKSDFLIYDKQDETRAKRRISIFGDLKRALNQRKGFELYYHPQIATDTGELAGVEALIRWTGSNAVSPAEFIPLAEQTGLITGITRWVIQESISQSSQWREQGLRIPVSVNFSAKCLHDTSLIHYLFKQCEMYGLPSSQITVEVTESAIMDHPEEAMQAIQSLRDKGFMISIDDFGTGQSSLAYLKNIPATELKIDQSFVLNLLADKHDAIVVKSIIQLGKDFGMHIVAEGVETEGILEKLTEYGCEIAQGYYFSPPLPAADLLAWNASRVSKG